LELVLKHEKNFFQTNHCFQELDKDLFICEISICFMWLQKNRSKVKNNPKRSLASTVATSALKRPKFNQNNTKDIVCVYCGAKIIACHKSFHESFDCKSRQFINEAKSFQEIDEHPKKQSESRFENCENCGTCIAIADRYI
jgi:hypothetical protein